MDKIEFVVFFIMFFIFVVVVMIFLVIIFIKYGFRIWVFIKSKIGGGRRNLVEDCDCVIIDIES